MEMGWSCPNSALAPAMDPVWRVGHVEAASGGGYGGGGRWNKLSQLSAIGGCTTGSSDSFAIEKGSSGGSSDNNSGGAGGASIHVNAAEIVIDGEISMNGDDGECCSGRNGGGGAGGGILLSAGVIEISGVLSANGGFGGDGATSSADGGGGGGGGRIKLFTTQSLTFTGAYTVDGGLGGIYGGYQPGQDGEAGTYTRGNRLGCPFGARSHRTTTVHQPQRWRPASCCTRTTMVTAPASMAEMLAVMARVVPNRTSQPTAEPGNMNMTTEPAMEAA